MDRLLALCALVALLMPLSAMPAGAQDTMGFTFTPDAVFPNTQVPVDEPFEGYIYLEPVTATVGGYECGFIHDPGELIVIHASGPSGWLNFGDLDNHLVGYGTPIPVTDEFVILATVLMIVTAQHEVYLEAGPSEPSSFSPPSPGYADGLQPDDLYACTGTVSTINGGLATATRSFSAIRDLFR